MESIVRRLLVKQQHGSVKKISCTTNLLETLDYILYSLDRGIPVDVVLSDFAKAFDTVPQRRLLASQEMVTEESSLNLQRYLDFAFNWTEDWLITFNINSVWSPYLKGDSDMIERVQRRSTKLVPTIYNFDYEERLEALSITTLAD